MGERRVNVKEELPKKFGNSCVDIIITSHGTLDIERLSQDEKKLIQMCKEQVNMVPITGWDFRDKGEKIAESCKTNYVVTEGCILYKKEYGTWKKEKMFSDVRLENVTVLNNVLFNKIEGCVLRSQANEFNVCVYVNLPDNLNESLSYTENIKNSVFEDLKKMMPTNDVGTSGIKSELDKYNIENEIINEYTLSLPDSPSNRYLIEKINGSIRTFLPYSVNFNNNRILLILNPKSNKFFEYLDVKKIVDSINTELGIEEEESFIKAQKDVCIDIFTARKDEVCINVLNKIIGKKKPINVVYISKKTESDKELVNKLFNEEGINLLAFGPKDTPDKLITIGINPTRDNEINFPPQTLCAIAKHNHAIKNKNKR